MEAWSYCPRPEIAVLLRGRADLHQIGITYLSHDTSAELQTLIDRLRRGDDSARRELLQRAHDRLLRIAATLFNEDFPGLHGRHDLESVVSEVWIRLAGALETTQPQTVEGFFGLVFTKVRQVLLDMAKRQRRHEVHRHLGPRERDEGGSFRSLKALTRPMSQENSRS